MGNDRFDDLAREFAQRPENRRRMLGRLVAAVAGVAGVSALEAGSALGAKPINCPPGLTLCGDMCRDTNSDNVNCGGCGVTCANDSVCRGGKCVPIPCTCPVQCPSGQIACNGVCVNPQTDSANCGACGNACPAGQSC